MTKYHKRKYIPKNPEKYIGNPNDIIMRSSWETRFAIWCDTRDDVIQWSSEGVIVPYICPTDNRPHRYFVDFIVKMRLANGEIETYLIEIKPDVQTRPPETKRKTKAFVESVAVWGKNSAKWKAANEYALARGWKFKVLTEYDLGIKKRK